MRLQKILWILLTLILVGLSILVVTKVQYKSSHKNNFQWDLDDCYNEDVLLYDPNDDFQDTMA